MALPKLNTPTYELVLPSTGEKIKYRPFLVKEQKMLMLAQESKDENSLADTLGQLVKSCTFEKIDAENSPMFDIEYIFLKLRAKSVGETAEISILARDDNKTRVPVKVDLDKIDIHMTADHTNEVQIDEKIKLVLKYPVLKDMKHISESDDDYKKMFAVLNKCIYEVHDGDKIYNTVDLTQKDIDEFVDSMNTSQLAKVLDFFTTMPKLRHPVSFINPKTKVKNEVVLEGLQTFLA
tara:strand:- start:317 stop:1024 length:708 start_codon:yes stop_codon:yes gene_type:complete